MIHSATMHDARRWLPCHLVAGLQAGFPVAALTSFRTRPYGSVCQRDHNALISAYFDIFRGRNRTAFWSTGPLNYHNDASSWHVDWVVTGTNDQDRYGLGNIGEWQSLFASLDSPAVVYCFQCYELTPPTGALVGFTAAANQVHYPGASFRFVELLYSIDSNESVVVVTRPRHFRIYASLYSSGGPFSAFIQNGVGVIDFESQILVGPTSTHTDYYWLWTAENYALQVQQAGVYSADAQLGSALAVAEKFYWWSGASYELGLTPSGIFNTDITDLLPLGPDEDAKAAGIHTADCTSDDYICAYRGFATAFLGGSCRVALGGAGHEPQLHMNMLSPTYDGLATVSIYDGSAHNRACPVVPGQVPDGYDQTVLMPVITATAEVFAPTVTGGGSGSDGFNAPGTTGTGGVGDKPWSLSGANAKVEDGTTTSVVQTDGTSSEYLRCYNFAFSLPAGATIVGIEANVKAKVDSSHTPDDFKAFIQDNTAGNTGDKSSEKTFAVTDTLTTHNLGGSTDLWGFTGATIPTKSDVENSQFGINIYVPTQSSGTTETPEVDYVELKVYYTT